MQDFFGRNGGRARNLPHRPEGRDAADGSRGACAGRGGRSGRSRAGATLSSPTALVTVSSDPSASFAVLLGADQRFTVISMVN